MHEIDIILILCLTALAAVIHPYVALVTVVVLFGGATVVTLSRYYTALNEAEKNRRTERSGDSS